MRKFTLLLAFLCFTGLQAALAQMDVKGTVTDARDGTPLPGVSIIVKGTLSGTVTDINGKYTLAVPAGHNELIFSFVGMLTQEVQINGRAVVDVSMQEDVVGLDEVVVTALGISREKKSLGYATQEVKGDEINQVKTTNVINSLSGKVAGVQIKTTGNFGGGTNLLIRGSSSITGNNQALIVIDGVPVNNDNTNNTGQLRGRSGFDYGSAATDINPADIESMNVLKGAAATALYGSRAANGAIIITTKKGSKRIGGSKIYGVNVSSNVTAGWVDKSTFPEYQNQYGAGYGTYYYSEGDYPGFEYVYDVDGDGEVDYTVPTYEDASFGQEFDPNVMLYQWDSYDPASPNYLKKTPWVAAENGPLYVMENPLSFTNNIDITGGGDATTFRLSYGNQNQTGVLPNSELKKNNFLFNGSYDILKNLTVSASANYIHQYTKGRNYTGYSDNMMSGFRQWMQTNVDYKMQEEVYDLTGRNITWNPNSPFDLAPAYWDNPYFQRYVNYEDDSRSRLLGYFQVDYKITSYLSFMARGAIDTYSEIQEERKDIGSSSGEFGVNRPDVTSGYSRFEKSFTETNFDFILRYNDNLGENFNLNAFIGTNIRRTKSDQVFASTDGGLIVPGLFALSNSVNQMQPPEERLAEIAVNGIFASASLGFKDFLFLDATIRRDQSSTLPEENNSYWYPSVSGSWLFSNNWETSWMQLGKLRLGYAEVGNDAPFASINDTYTQFPVFGGTNLFSLPNTKNNPELKPERTKSIEGGLEMAFLKKRLGFDLALYKTNTVDQIIPVAVSTATGYSTKYVNAGEIMNKGVELTVYGVPVQSDNFKWDIAVNFARNINEVVSLKDSLQNLQLASLQGGVTINARVGEPYGAIQGTDFMYYEDENGNVTDKKIVKSNGYYAKTPASDQVIGNVNPDFTMGINNRLSYKSWSFSFLIDWQQGGDIFSLDLYYGMATGLYPETVFLNDLGNPVRDPLTDDATSGGLILEGVQADGSVNTVRVHGDDYRVFGYSQNPNAKFIYDASYVKLREVVLTYTIPSKIMSKVKWIHGASFSLVGSNLWIIHKNLPYADPEASQSSGNVQGWQSGVMPATKNVGFTVNLQF